MRKPHSITNKLFTAINSFAIGDQFKIDDVYDYSMSCDSSYGPRQRVYDLLCALNQAGLISRVKRGVYEVKYEIPDELTATDLEYYKGYKTRFNENGTVARKSNPFDIESYKAGFDDDHPTVHSGPGTVVTESGIPEKKTLYKMTGESFEGKVVYEEIEVPVYDQSYDADINTFETIEEIESFYGASISLDDQIDIMEDRVMQSAVPEQEEHEPEDFINPGNTEENNIKRKEYLDKFGEPDILSEEEDVEAVESIYDNVRRLIKSSRLPAIGDSVYVVEDDDHLASLKKVVILSYNISMDDTAMSISAETEDDEYDIENLYSDKEEAIKVLSDLID